MPNQLTWHTPKGVLSCPLCQKGSLMHVDNLKSCSMYKCFGCDAEFSLVLTGIVKESNDEVQLL